MKITYTDNKVLVFDVYIDESKSTKLFEIISIFWTKQNMVTIDTVLFLHLFCICISKLKQSHIRIHTHANNQPFWRLNQGRKQDSRNSLSKEMRKTWYEYASRKQALSWLNNSVAININFPCEKPCSPFPFTNFNSKINTLSKGWSICFNLLL